MPALITLEDARDILNLKDPGDDDLVKALIEGVTDVIEHEVGAVTQREVTFDIRQGGCGVALPEQNIIELTSGSYSRSGFDVDVTGMEVSNAGILRNVQGGNLPLEPWTLTAQVGMSTIPEAIKIAAKEVLKEAYSIRYNEAEPHTRPFLISYRSMVWLEPYRTGPGIA